MLGMSVATDAFTMAELIGVKRIILIGQDLAYAGAVSYTHLIKINREMRRKYDTKQEKCSTGI